MRVPVCTREWLWSLDDWAYLIDPPRMTGKLRGDVYPKRHDSYPKYMNRDPELFGKNTEHFDPTRYLDVLSRAWRVRHQGNGYGLGRRNCVCRHVADNSLFINMAIILWVTKIERRKDASGRSIPLDLYSWVDVGLVAPADFITYCYVDANVGIISADIRSPSNSRSHYVSRRLLGCLHRNVSCGGFDHEVKCEWVHG
jgi:hypothetical protein